MDYKLPKEVKNILNKFSAAGYQIYIVGGAVRDLLMNREVNDWDFTTDAKPEEILKLFPDGFYDNNFGTVGIPIEKISDNSRGVTASGSSTLRAEPSGSDSNEVPQQVPTASETSEDIDGAASRQDPERQQILEITTMRKEGEYKDFRHPTEVGWTNKIEEDLARRDFTINAMALSADGKIIDPFGGQKDIKNELIQAVGDPNKRFQEDALRLMRAIRIVTQLEFDIEKNTFEAIKKDAEFIEEVSTERIRDELLKLLASTNPYIGIVKLRETGILGFILSEIEQTFQVEQTGPKHARIYNIGEHSLLTLKETPSSDPITRLAALIHDLGKVETVKIAEDGNVTFYNHEVAGGRIALNIAKRLRLSKKQTDKLFRLVRWHLFTVDENQTDSAIRRFIKNVGVENIEEMMALRVGDRVGGGTQRPVSWRMEKFRDRIDQVLEKPFSVTDLKVSGKDVMETLKITPGPKVGEVLNKLFEEVLENTEKNNREYLLEKIKQLN